MKKVLIHILSAFSFLLALSCADKDSEGNEPVDRHQFVTSSGVSGSGENYDMVILTLDDGVNKSLTITFITTFTDDNLLKAGRYTPSENIVNMRFICGAYDNDGDYGTYMFEDDGAGGGYTRYFTGGSLTVSDSSDDMVAITIDLIDATGERLSAEYKGPLNIAGIYGYDKLDDDIAITGIVYAEAQYLGAASGLDVWSILLSTSKKNNVACTDILLTFITPGGDISTLPINTYPMSEGGDYFYVNTSIYGMTSGSSPFGCWYLVTDDGVSYDIAVPAVASRGWVRTAKYGADGNTVSFEFYDTAGHKATGSYSGKISIYDMTSISSATSMLCSAQRSLPLSVSPDYLHQSRIPSAR